MLLREQPRAQDRRRHARGFACAWRRDEHERAALAQPGDDLRQHVIDREAGHLIAEKSVGFMNTESTFSTSLPFRSLSSRTLIQSGSARNAFHDASAASLLGKDST